MSTRQLRKRVEKIKAIISPASDGSFTFEELCRELWRRDKKGFLKRAQTDAPGLMQYVQRLQQEDLAYGRSRS
jgi:hypothetical protein